MFLRKSKSLLHDQRGGITIVTAFVLVIIIAVAGGAIDFWRANQSRSSLQASLDAALLAAAKRSMTDEQAIREELAAFFEANGGLQESLQGLDVDVEILDDRLRASATGKISTSLLKVVGMQYLNVGIVSEARRGGGAVEIALVLDVTGSMAQFMPDLRRAASLLVNDVFDAAGGDAERVQLALVPYVGAVNIGNSPDVMRWMDVDGRSRYHARLFRNQLIARSYSDWSNWTGNCNNAPPVPSNPGGGSGGGSGGGGSGGGGATPAQPNPGTGTPATPATPPPRGGGGDRTDIDFFHNMPSKLLTGLTGLVGIPSAEASNPRLQPVISQHVETQRDNTKIDCTRRRDRFDMRNPNNFTYFDLFDAMPNVQWKGCVEARPHDGSPRDLDVTDVPPNPSQPDTMFVPYFWWDHRDNQNGGFVNNYLRDKPYTNTTTNTFRYNGKDWTGQGNHRTYNILKYDGSNANQNTSAPDPTGPNAFCPEPIVPLTNDRRQLLNAINGLNHWRGSGTNTAEGMMWGWRVLSPNQPFDQGVAYGEKKKIVVLMTDGMNAYVDNWRNNSGEPGLKSDLGAYGYFEENRYGLRNNDPDRSLDNFGYHIDDRLRRACQNFKNMNRPEVRTAPPKEQDVLVFTITFNINDTWTKQLFDECATQPSWHYSADSGAELTDAFRTISSIIAQLHLAR